MMKRLHAAFAGLVLGLSLLTTAQAEDIYVSAAASLTNALGEISELYKSRNGQNIKASYAASSALAQQIENGAPAQVFASADIKWMDYLTDRKLIDADSRRNLLGNVLVVVAPLDSTITKQDITEKTDLAALAGDGRIATGNPDSVPVGLYFKQSMERSGQWSKVSGKIASADSVRSALLFVERGEASLGVVYATDAAISKKVKVIGAIPDNLHDPVIYPFALVAGKQTTATQSYFTFLQSQEAKGIFAKYGFKVN